MIHLQEQSSKAAKIPCKDTVLAAKNITRNREVCVGCRAAFADASVVQLTLRQTRIARFGSGAGLLWHPLLTTLRIAATIGVAARRRKMLKSSRGNKREGPARERVYHEVDDRRIERSCVYLCELIDHRFTMSRTEIISVCLDIVVIHH